MTLLDSGSVLVPECPICWTIDVEIVYWEGAWVKVASGDYVRRKISPGEVRKISCTCNSCGNEWSEYVAG